MNIIFLLLSFFICVVILLRKFDFLSFGALSFVMYSINCAFGNTWIIRAGPLKYYYNENISTSTYLLVFAQQIVILAVLLWDKAELTVVNGRIVSKRRLRKAKEAESDSEEKANADGRKSKKEKEIFWNVLLAFSIIVFAYNFFIKVGITRIFSSSSKSEIMGGTSGLFSYAIWGAILSFFHGVQVSSKKKTIIAALPLIFIFFIGARSYLVVIAAGFIVMKAGNRKYSFKNNIKIAVIGLVMIFLLLVFKIVYKDLRNLDFAAVKADLERTSVMTSLSDIEEFRIVFSLYDYTVRENLSLPAIDILGRVVSVVPFANRLITTKYPLRYSSWMVERFQATYGLGSNFWAENWAMGGTVLLLIITLLWLVFLRKSDGYIGRKKNTSVFLITMASYCSFYIHRLDWAQILGCLKSVVFFYIIYLIFDNLYLKRSGKNADSN